MLATEIKRRIFLCRYHNISYLRIFKIEFEFKTKKMLAKGLYSNIKHIENQCKTELIVLVRSFAHNDVEILTLQPYLTTDIIN